MRWPLRNQILLPVAALLLVTLLGVSLTSVALAVRRTRGQIERQLRDVARTLVESQFPLTDNVLRQMRGLSGAEFVLTDSSGEALAASRAAFDAAALPRERRVSHWDQIALTRPIPVGEENYFHTALRLPPGRRSSAPPVLHILYPERNYRDAIWEAVYPPAAIGGVALVLAVLLGTGIAARVSRPIGRLQAQVDQIAEGNFQPLPLPRRDDEIRDLAQATNHMAAMLARYEAEIRRSEQLRTLDQLGGGIAHQMRNAVTGCRMALDLHRRECPSPADDESLSVAVRQLTLMEQHLRRFLSLGSPRENPHEEVNLVAIVENILPLVRPAAGHVGVELRWQAPPAPLLVRGDCEGLEQLLVNLLLNGIEAAGKSGGGEGGTGSSNLSPSPPPPLALSPPRPLAPSRLRRSVEIALRAARSDRAMIEVSDTGPGPAAEVRDTLFEPLVTEKPDGTGLGLSVAQAIAERHNAAIRWERRDGRTCFWLELPLLQVATNSP
jgi:signal transduction histidine kinase